MSWNNGYERKKISETQERLADEYRKCGMSEHQIHEMHEFDLRGFRSDRRFRSHIQPLEISTGDNDESETNILCVLSNTSITSPNYSNRFWWIEELGESYELISNLSDMDKELLTLLVIDGYSETEIAKNIYKVSINAISKKVIRIRNKLLQSKKKKKEANHEV